VFPSCTLRFYVGSPGYACNFFYFLAVTTLDFPGFHNRTGELQG